MAQKKRILIACGTGIATSTAVSEGIKEGLSERGIDVATTRVKASEVNRDAVEGYDLVVTTTPLSVDTDVPIIKTLAFMTGQGKEEVLDEIEELLTESGTPVSAREGTRSSGRTDLLIDHR